jgi:hypothetical protein
VKGSCTHGNESSGSIKRWEILEWLGDWRLLKKSYLVTISVSPTSFDSTNGSTFITHPIIRRYIFSIMTASLINQLRKFTVVKA